MAAPALRSRDQLRARHPHERRDGDGRRTAHRRLRQRRRRTVARFRASLRSGRAYRRQCAVAGDRGAGPRARWPHRCVAAHSRGTSRGRGAPARAFRRLDPGRPARQRRTRDQAMAGGAIPRSGRTSRPRSRRGDRADRHAARADATGDGARGTAADRVLDTLRTGSADRGRGDRAARSFRHRRHRADAPGARGRHAGRRGVRAVGSATLRAARDARRRGPDRSAVQPVQSHPPAAGALHRPHAGLPRGRRHGPRHRGDRRRAARVAGRR